MTGTLISAAQAVVVGGMVLAGQWIVARFSKKANEETTDVAAQEKATTAWQKYAEEMKGRLDVLETRMESQQAQIDEGRKRISMLERQSERDKDLIRRLLTRLRAAITEIKRLGGEVPPEDTDLTDLAQLRLDITDDK